VKVFIFKHRLFGIFSEAFKSRVILNLKTTCVLDLFEVRFDRLAVDPDYRVSLPSISNNGELKFSKDDPCDSDFSDDGEPIYANVIPRENKSDNQRHNSSHEKY
jgi:hypothetical protein